MKPPVTRLSEADKAEFDRQLAVWQARLGLNDWRIGRALQPSSKPNMAQVKLYHPNRMASVFLGEDFGPNTPITPASIEYAALHELLHVLLGELTNQVEYGIEGAARDSAEHRVIHTLEKLLMTKPTC